MQELTGWSATQEEIAQLSNRIETLLTITTDSKLASFDPDLASSEHALINARKIIKDQQNDKPTDKEVIIKLIEKLGGREIIYTDIGRDGMLEGVNTDNVKRVMDSTSLIVYAAGGVTTIKDIENLNSIQSPGCIVGKALYEGKLDLAEAIKTAG